MGVLQTRQRRCRGQQLAQHDHIRHADALTGQVELSDAIFAQRDERDAAEVGQRGVLEHYLGQLLGSVARDVVEPDTALQGRMVKVSVNEAKQVSVAIQVSAAIDAFSESEHMARSITLHRVTSPSSVMGHKSRSLERRHRCRARKHEAEQLCTVRAEIR